MSYKCLLDSTTKVVVNVIALEDGAVWTPPVGTELALQHDGEIGHIWNGSQFEAPPPVLENAVIQPSTDSEQKIG
jgi:hypothetical protein